MSYDGYVQLRVAEDPVIPEGVSPWDVDDHSVVTLAEIGNYTSNVSPMWTRALSAVAPRCGVALPDDGMLSLGETHDWTCSALAPLYRAAATWMVEHESELRELNPANGWGDYEGAVEYLDRAATLCERFAEVKSQHGVSHVYWSH